MDCFYNTVHVFFFFLLTAPQPDTVVFQSRSLTGKWSGKTLATETRWFTSATPDSGSLAPQYGSANRTTAGQGCSQFASVSPRLLTVSRLSGNQRLCLRCPIHIHVYYVIYIYSD